MGCVCVCVQTEGLTGSESILDSLHWIPFRTYCHPAALCRDVGVTASLLEAAGVDA
jgi:hypothetical protein